MARQLFVVEDAWLIRGRGILVEPGILPMGEERLQAGDPILLKRPDGSLLNWKIGGLEMFVRLVELRPHAVAVFLNGLGKEDVPIGTEVWSIDPAVESEHQRIEGGA
jgi:hypothetical protein